jgi:hypothetical protein
MINEYFKKKYNNLKIWNIILRVKKISNYFKGYNYAHNILLKNCLINKQFKQFFIYCLNYPKGIIKFCLK